MSKKAIAKILSKLPGFKARGPFYIGKCTREVVSGYVLDAPPHGVSIWRFLLPAYDSIEFLHMGLGKRIAEYSEEAGAPVTADLESSLQRDWEILSAAQDGRSLIDYLDREQVQGDYCQWAKFLAYVRLGELDAASRLEAQWQSSAEFPRVQVVAANLKRVLEARQRAGWNGVQELLDEWANQTGARFCQA